MEMASKDKKIKKSALAVKIGLAVKINYDDLASCRKERVGLSEKKKYGVALASREYPFWILLWHRHRPRLVRIGEI